MTPTNPTHGRIEVNVAAALSRFVRTQNLGIVMAGEVGIFTTRNPDTVRAPDVLFLSHKTGRLPHAAGWIPGCRAGPRG